MAANQPIPIFTDLATLYANLGTTFNHAERWDNLTNEFVQRFGRKPTYIARAPGRVKCVKHAFSTFVFVLNLLLVS